MGPCGRPRLYSVPPPFAEMGGWRGGWSRSEDLWVTKWGRPPDGWFKVGSPCSCRKIGSWTLCCASTVLNCATSKPKSIQKITVQLLQQREWPAFRRVLCCLRTDSCVFVFVVLSSYLFVSWSNLGMPFGEWPFDVRNQSEPCGCPARVTE